MTDTNTEVVERLKAQEAKENESQRSCKVQMLEAGAGYPCCWDCPCALRQMVIAFAAERDALKAENERLREALQAAHDDLKLRAELDLDDVPVVAVGQSVWMKICAALKD